MKAAPHRSLDKRSRLALCAAVLAAAACGTPARAAAPVSGPAAGPVCDTWADAIFIEDRYYAVVLHASTPHLDGAHVTLASDDHDFRFNLTDVSLRPEAQATPSATPETGTVRFAAEADGAGAKFVSAPVFVALPYAVTILAATAEPLTEGPQSAACRHAYGYTDAYRKQLDQQFSLSAEDAALRKALVKAFYSSDARVQALSTIARSDPKTCRVPYAQAATTWKSEASYPAIARSQGVTGTTVIAVDLDSRGAVLAASIHRSSGNAALDAEAQRAAANSKYSPETFRCDPIGGRYLFVVQFTQR